MSRRKKKMDMRTSYTLHCDGRTEVVYFRHLHMLLHSEYSKRNESTLFPITMKIEERKNGQLFKGLLDSRSEKKWIVFDFDNDTALFCKNLKEAKQHRVGIAYTSMCFELWMILHKNEFNTSVNNPEDYERDLKRLYEIADLENHKSELVLTHKIMERITLDDVRMAIRNAENLRKINQQSKSCLYEQHNCFSNPDLTIHDLVKDLFAVAKVPVT